MLAHFHGQTWNAAGPARSLGLSEPTVRRYLDLLSGLLHRLLGLRTQRDLLFHPKAGASWEGYAIEEVLRSARPDEAYFWATHQGAELDLLLFKNGRRVGADGRFAAVWEMVCEADAIRGVQNVREPRLQRSVLRIERR